MCGYFPFFSTGDGGEEPHLFQSWLKFVSRFVKAAEMNAKNTIMNIVKNVPRLVWDTQKNAEKKSLDERNSISYSFYYPSSLPTDYFLNLLKDDDILYIF